MRSLTLICFGLFLSFVFVLPGCQGPSASTDFGDNMEVGFAESPIADHSGLDTIIITSVKALVSNVDLYQSYNSEYQSVKPDPVVMNMSPGAGYQKMGSGIIGNGIYQRVRFQLHQPAAGEVVSDAEFNTGSSNSERSSVIIKGTFNGVAFNYKLHSTVSKVFVFPSNVELDINPLSITVLYNPALWFRGPANIILNPLSDVNWDQIDLNISNSFKRAFMDNDHNGSPDLP